MKALKGQSATEFLTTYGYVFIIITVVMGVLLLFFNIPRTVIPAQCTIFSGFTCSDSVFIITKHGASLLIVAADNQPGVINVTSFNAVIGYKNSSSGFCLPSRVLGGEDLYCIANFTFTQANTTLVNTSIYFGTFNMTADYCISQAQNLSTEPCPSSQAYTYGGSIRIQPSVRSVYDNTLMALIANAPSTFYYLPVVISNKQPTATVDPMQVPLAFPTAHYSQYINGNWSNVEFSTLPAGKGTLLEAWVESGSSDLITNTLVWVNLPDGIAANSSATIYANFLPLTSVVMSQFGPTGEAPNKSTTYGEFDNGRYVFTFYDNFAGSTLSNQWTSAGGGAVTVNNGLKITAGGSITSVVKYSSLNRLLEFALAGPALNTNHYDSGFNSNLFPTTNALYWLRVSGSSSTEESVTANTLNSNAFGSFGSSLSGCPCALSIGTNSTAAIAGLYAYGGSLNVLVPSIYTTTANVYKGGPAYIEANSAAGTLQAYWVRIRSMPPDDVMPTATYGNVVQAT